jgi:glycerophosphoryl diester phosphodiesterase
MGYSSSFYVGAWASFGILLWVVSLILPNQVPLHFSGAPPPSGFLLTPEKLRENIQRAGDELVNGLVSHRGYHYSIDDMKRPLENTLSAYEHAWACGVKYAECDVQMTKDGELILSHDLTLKRLALHPENAKKAIADLDFAKDIINFPLKDGSRVPKLGEVLQSAKRFGKEAKLVVEIKDDNVETARKTSVLAATELGEHISLVMSFHLSAVAEFAKNNPRRRGILSLFLMVKPKSDDGSVFDLQNLGAIDKLLMDNHLDGAYLQYDPTFLTDTRFQGFCQRYIVGIWGLDRDSATTAATLIKKGVKFVNTDFEDDFFHV